MYFKPGDLAVTIGTRLNNRQTVIVQEVFPTYVCENRLKQPELRPYRIRKISGEPFICATRASSAVFRFKRMEIWVSSDQLQRIDGLQLYTASNRASGLWTTEVAW